MNKRTVIAFAVAPLVVALIVVTTTVTAGGTIGDEPSSPLITLLVWYAGAASLTAALAVPVFVFLDRMNLVRWWSAVAVGLLVGFVATLIVRSPSSPGLQGTAPLSIIGGIAALVFWLIWRQGNRAQDV